MATTTTTTTTTRRPRINSEFLVYAIAGPSTPTHLQPRQRTLPSHLTLLASLPPTSYLKSLSEQAANDTRRSQIISDALSTAVETPLDAHPASPPLKGGVGAAVHSPTLGGRTSSKGKGKGKSKGQLESFEVLRAIEKKDLMTLMKARDEQFELLLEVKGGSTPLVHAMRLGASHREVAILLTGAISRRVNDLTDTDLQNMDPYLKGLLRSIRANLKIAITYGLTSQQTDLLASYLQVIIMSEGDKFVTTSSQKVSLACRTGPPGRPVESAEKIVEKWVGRELSQGQIAAVGEYRANAVGDLVLLGLWEWVTTLLHDLPALPTYYFARDDRVTKTLADEIATLKKSGRYSDLPKLLRTQLEKSIEVLSKRNIAGRERIDLLQRALDA